MEVSIPVEGVHARHASVRAPSFGASILRTSGLATDWGLQTRFTSYIARQRRPQLSIVLAGRGYVATDGVTTSLGVGDALVLDQARGDHEGYAGAPCEVLILEWEPDTGLGPAHVGRPFVGRLGPRDLARLSALSARFSETTPLAWMIELVAILRALGLGATSLPRAPSIASERVDALYRALGDVRTQLDRHPSLPELGESVGLSERQTRRDLEALETEFAMPIDGFRDALSDMRMSHAQQLLSIESLSLARVAQLSGFRSTIALNHAFTSRCAQTPGDLRTLLAHRWR